MIIQGNKYPSDFEAKKQMIEIGKILEQKDYAVAGDGSMSVRIGPNAVWFTEEGADKGHLLQDSFIRTDMNGKQSISGRSRNLPADYEIHLAVYQQNPGLRCVIHSYPAAVTAAGLEGRGAEPALFSPSVQKLGAIPCCGQDHQQIREQAVTLAKSGNGLMIAGDGCILWGESTLQALQLTQALDYYEKVVAMAGSCDHRNCANCGFRNAGVQPGYCNAGQGGAPAAAGPAPVSIGTMDGVTPIIRPGDAAGYSLPDGREQNKPQAATSPVAGTVSAGVRQPAQAPGGSGVHAAQNGQGSGGYYAHPVTTSAPSNAQFLKPSARYGQAGTAPAQQPLKPITISVPPTNMTIRPSQRYGSAAQQTGTRLIGQDGSNIGTTGRFYGYTYARPAAAKPAGTTPGTIGSGNAGTAGGFTAAPASYQAVQPVLPSAANAQAAAPVHGTAAASSQCPSNVIGQDQPLPYVRQDGPVKDAPRQEIMNEVIRRTILSWKK